MSAKVIAFTLLFSVLGGCSHSAVPTSPGETATSGSGASASISGWLVSQSGSAMTAAGAFDVDGKLIQTDSHTVFRRGDTPTSFADLAIGTRVHVTGLATGAVILATLVTIQNTDVDIPVEVNGTVSALSGPASAFQF